jgi:hypothetical protein
VWTTLKSTPDRKVERSGHGIAEEEAAQASSVDALVDRQPCEQNHRHGVPGKLPGLLRGQALRLDRPAGQGVITQHARIMPLERDIGPSEVALLVLADQPTEEVIKRGLAAVEAFSHVSTIESLDPPLIHASWPSLP